MHNQMNLIKKIIPFAIKRRVKEHLGVPSLHWSLCNLKKQHFYPKIILDIGAYEGLWTLAVLEVFPEAKVMMVEAQENKKAALQEISNRHPGVKYSIALLSAAEGEQKLFRENETGSQVITANEKDEKSYILLSRQLDVLLEQEAFPYPDFLKLDVQNHELEVLKGASKCLDHAEVCLLEVSLLNFGNAVPLLSEVAAFMKQRGFQAYDISQLMRRPFDKALFQLDMFFVKESSPLVKSSRWI